MDIFYNSLGDFQWASVAAIIAGIGALISFVFSFLGYLNSRRALGYQRVIDQKKIDADIISKSRMHWIDNTKVLVSRFLTNVIDLSAEYVMFNEKILQLNLKYEEVKTLIKIKEDKTTNYNARKQATEVLDYWTNEGEKNFNDDMTSRVSRINVLMKQIHEDYTLIKLNFSNNDENNVIIKLIYEIYEELRVFSLNNGWNQFSGEAELKSAISKAKSIRKSSSEKVEELVDFLRSYYKKEWEKVKRGE